MAALCAVCVKPIYDDKEDSIFCEGVCKDWIHRTCAGLSKSAFESARDSPDDYFCHYCYSRCLKDEIKVLRERVSLLEAELKAELKAAPPASSPTVHENSTVQENSWSNVVKDSSKTSATQRPNPNPYNDQPKKFNIVIYGIVECAKGSSRLDRSTSDVREVTEILQKINPDLQSQSVCDCARLGKYSAEKKRPRPILVKLFRSHEVTSILDNRKKLSKCLGISIKPLLTKEQLSIESILLKERWKLINAGNNRSCIKIKGNSLLLNNLAYGSVANNKFILKKETPDASTSFLGSSPEGPPASQ